MAVAIGWNWNPREWTLGVTRWRRTTLLMLGPIGVAFMFEASD